MDAIPEKYMHDHAIIRETAEQIIRDLKMAGFEITFSDNPYNAFDELKIQLTPIIRKLVREDPHSFHALLYRVDINEKDYNRTLSESENNEREEKLSELIIRREFQKVITRKYFSENK